MVRLSYTMAIITMILGMLDVISTNMGLAAGAQEANPVMAGVMGMVGGLYYLPKLCLQALVATMVMWSPTRTTIAVMAVCYGWMASVIANNFMYGFGYGFA